MFNPIETTLLKTYLDKMRSIQLNFLNKYNVNDIWSNSKIFEIIIANQLGHILIPGHSGSKDAKDKHGNIFEYKHYKEGSSNHTWTFNDYSATTIKELKTIKSVIFAHIEDPATFDWYYEVPGKVIAKHLYNITIKSTNKRKMWNVSRAQIENTLGYKKINTNKKITHDGAYYKDLKSIFKVIKELEDVTGISNLLTSNKLWELVVAAALNHNVNSEQGGRAGAHDAFDKDGNLFEYKVAKNYSWNFQDISENVLKKYYADKSIILAVVDKNKLEIKNIFSAPPNKVVPRLKKKLKEKRARFKAKGKALRRLQVSLSRGDLKRISAKNMS